MVRRLCFLLPLLFLTLNVSAHNEDKRHKKPLTPTASFSATQITFKAPFKMKFDGSASSSPNGPIHDYIWDFGDDSRGHFECEDEHKDHRSNVHKPVVEHAYKKPGIYRVTLKIVDKKGGHAKIYKDIRVVEPQPPIAKLTANPASGVAPFFAFLDASTSSSPVGLPLTYRFTFGDGQILNTSSAQVAHQFTNPGSYSVTVRVQDSSGLFSEKSVVIAVTAPVIPPAPIAPPLAATAPQSFDQRVNFIYQGPSAVQTGVQPGAIKANQVTLLRGRVLDDSGAVLAGVAISVFGKSELGRTISRSDGAFDIAVNGGDVPVTIRYSRSGYTPAQRTFKVAALDHIVIDDVLLSKYDRKVTAIQMNSSSTQIHTANAVVDQDGTRTATVVIKPQTSALLVMPDGSTKSVTQLSVRATEVTVGPNGPDRMPAELPTNTSYTYAVDLSADEAIALGAKSINFSKPVSYYLDNFRNIPVGSSVPSGFLDLEKGYWVPEKDGIVVKVLSVSGGQAVLDVRGSGQPASANDLSDLGIDTQELQTLAQYPVGKSLWRIPISHFSFFDFNFAGIPLADHFENEPAEPTPPCPGGDCLCKTGCEIDVGRRVWRETIPLLGTGLQLRYSSDRSYGWFGDSTIGVTLLKGPTPNNLKYIDVATNVAGRDFKTRVLPSDNKDYRLIWDGKDSFGRNVTQPSVATVNLEYVFDIMDWIFNYNFAHSVILGDATFNSPWDPTAVGVRLASRGLFVYKQAMTFNVTPPNSYLSANVKNEVGGWTFANHHQFDPVRKRLYLGSGAIIDTKDLPLIVRDVAGGGLGGDGGLALGSALRFPVYYRRNADGSAYISDSGHSRIRKIDVNGVISTYAGTGTAGNSGDGGPASSAQIGTPVGIFPGPDGSIYFCDASAHVVRKISPSGIISTIAGTGVAGFSGDGGPATSAQINTPLGLILMNDGSLLFADSGNHIIRQVLVDGTIRTYAGKPGVAGYAGDGGSARDAKFNAPDLTFMDIAQNLYITDSANHVIRMIRPGGTIETVVGSGQQGFSGDGGPALSAKLNAPQNVVVSDRGVIYFSDSGNHVVRSVDTAGIIRTIAGKPGIAGYDGGDNAPDQSVFNFPTGLFLMPDESLYIADTFNNRIRYLTSTPLVNIGGQLAVPAKDGSEVYLFDAQSGRHQATLFGKTGSLKWQFAYDANGNLTSMTNQDGDITQIQRDASGVATQIVAPYGQIFTLSLDGNGYLKSLRQSTGELYQITNSTSGLITQFQNPRGGYSSVVYNPDGTIAQDTDPAGATQLFTSLLNKITNTSDMGRKVSSQQVHDSYFPSLWSIVTELADGRKQTEQQVGSVVYKQSNAGNEASQSRVDARLGPNSRYPAGRLFSTADSGFISVTEQARNYTVRSPFDFDMVETKTKDSNFIVSTSYSSSTLTETISTGAGRLSRTVIDSKERPVLQQVGAFTPVTYLYDTRGRLAQVKQGSRSSSLTYDSNGHLATLTDPLGQITSFLNDASGRVLSKRLPDGRVVQSGYDGNSNLIGLTTPANLTHAMDFSPLDKISLYRPPTLPSGQTPIAYNYNRDGQISSIVRPDGNTINYFYDEPRDRIRRIGSTTEARFYTYDSKARLATANSSDGVFLQYQFDGILPLARNYSVDALSTSLSVAYSNPGLRITSRTIGTHSVNLSYDADETLSQVDSLNIGRDAQSGLITGLTLNNVQEAQSYSSFAELASKQVKYNSSSLFTQSFTRDAMGRIKQKTETINGVTNIYQYFYDTAGRLTDVVKNGSNVGHYAYDANSNRTSAIINGSSETGIYDAQDRIVTYNGKSYTFNANGDLTAKSDGSTYVYDIFGQIKSASVGGSTVNYKYDAEGHRVARFLNGSPDRSFVYNELGQLVGEFDAGGAITASFHYASQSHSPDFMIKGSVRYYLVKDHLGSVRLVVNSSNGTIAQRMDYDEFGRALSDSNPGFQPFGFAGGLYDPNTKLVRFGARDYDPETGRWTSKDPILFNGGDTNLYGYVLNDPINLIDKTGQFPQSIEDVFDCIQAYKSDSFRVNRENDQKFEQELDRLRQGKRDAQNSCQPAGADYFDKQIRVIEAGRKRNRDFGDNLRAVCYGLKYRPHPQPVFPIY